VLDEQQHGDPPSDKPTFVAKPVARCTFDEQMAGGHLPGAVRARHAENQYIPENDSHGRAIIKDVPEASM
jgi:hypothetical protein